jgi:DNA-directed RNA polymerase specialized sigma24 family protein
VVDEEDIALSVLRCLYDGSARGQYSSIVNRQELWQLLATITIRKVIDQQRLLVQPKRGGGRVRGDSVLQAAGDVHHLAGFDQFGREVPTPETLAIATEEFQRLMVMLNDDRLRQIAQSKLEGFTNEDIGRRLGLTCRSIERKLQRIREAWEDELEQ